MNPDVLHENFARLAQRHNAVGFPREYAVFDLECERSGMRRVTQTAMLLVDHEKGDQVTQYTHDPESEEKNLAGAVKMFTEVAKRGVVLVGQNILRFDIPKLVVRCERVLGFHETFGFAQAIDSIPVIDTGLLFKAAADGLRMQPGEHPTDFYKRIPPRGGRWSLDYALAFTGMFESEQAVADWPGRHTASGDCTLTKMLLDALVSKSVENTLKEAGL